MSHQLPVVSKGPRLLCFFAHGAAGPWDIVRCVGPVAQLAIVIEDGAEGGPQAAETFQSLDVPVFPSADAALSECGPFDGVVTYSEACVVAAARAAERWQLPTMPAATAEVLRSKLAQRRRLNEAGCDDVPFIGAHTFGDVRAAVRVLGLPVVLKPDRGWGSRDARRIITTADLEAAASTIDPGECGGYIVERYLQGRHEGRFGDYVSVEVVMAAGEPLFLAVTGKLPLIPPFREPGQFWPSHLSAAERVALCEFVLRAVRALEVEIGALHVEVKLCADGPHIIEVNGRVGGFIPELVLAGTGIDLLGALAQVALGRQIEPLLDERTLLPPPAVRVQHSSLVPPGAVQLVGAPSASDLRKNKNVDFYRLITPLGSSLSDGVGTREMDLLQAVADDHDSMFAVLRGLLRSAELTLRMDDGSVCTLSALEIAARNNGAGID